MTIQRCPFCGYDHAHTDEIDLDCFAVVCPECEAMGPVNRDSPEAAIAQWNLRLPDGPGL